LDTQHRASIYPIPGELSLLATELGPGKTAALISLPVVMDIIGKLDLRYAGNKVIAILFPLLHRGKGHSAAFNINT
jgi:hypothetical protein